MPASVEAIEKAIIAYHAAWKPNNADEVASYFTEDCVFEDLAFEAKFEGHAGVKAFFDITYNGIPDFKVVPTQIVVQGDRAGVAWEMTGTHKGDLPNLPATGKPFKIRASSAVVMEGDKMKTLTDYWNPVQFAKQVGLHPSQ